MQEKDVVSIDYFENSARFADLINGYIYHGEELIKPEDICEMNRSVARIEHEGENPTVQVIMADIVCKVKQNQNIAHVTLMALENQSDIHYAMPIRVLNAEGANYHQQWRRRADWHKEEKDLRGAEFLSGFSKEDKVVPVITIVVYWGKEPWDAPRSMKEMMDMGGYPKAMQDMIVDYPIHLLEVRKYADLSEFHTDIKYVFGFLQNEDSKEQLKAYVEDNHEAFTELNQSAYDMISVMSHCSKLLNWEKETGEGGNWNMCQAINEMIEDGRQEGIKEGIKEGRQSINILIQHLLRDGRSKEIEIAVTDQEYQHKLLEEYSLL